VQRSCAKQDIMLGYSVSNWELYCAELNIGSHPALRTATQETSTCAPFPKALAGVCSG